MQAYQRGVRMHFFNNCVLCATRLFQTVCIYNMHSTLRLGRQHCPSSFQPKRAGHFSAKARWPLPALSLCALTLRVPCRCADCVLLNKTDMLAERQLDSLAAIVTSLNPLAKVSPQQHLLADVRKELSCGSCTVMLLPGGRRVPALAWRLHFKECPVWLGNTGCFARRRR